MELEFYTNHLHSDTIQLLAIVVGRDECIAIMRQIQLVIVFTIVWLRWIVDVVINDGLFQRRHVIIGIFGARTSSFAISIGMNTVGITICLANFGIHWSISFSWRSGL